MPRERRPVDVPQDDAAAWAERAVDLRERRRGVVDVLEHLHGERRIEVLALHRKRGRIALVEGHVRVRLGAARGDGEHRRADVDADDGAFRANRIQELGDVEARPAAGVEDPLARLGAECLVD